MFSARLDWNLAKNRLSELLEAKRRGGADILDLTESNPTRAGFAYPPALVEALADQRSLLYEPAPLGLDTARAAISDYYRKRVSPEHIVLTASTSEAYSYLFKLLADPGDEILVPRPSYPLFEFLAKLESVRIVHYPLVYHRRWEIDLDALRRAVTPRTRAIVVVNPNNPTGSFVKPAELDALCDLGIPLISDEVFSDYAFCHAPSTKCNRATTAREWSGRADVLSFCLSGLSKVVGLPQMKAAWIVTAGPRDLQQAARKRLEFIADSYLSVGTPVQHALPRLLAEGSAVRRQIQQRTAANLAWLRAAVAANPAFELLDVEAGWNAILRVPRTRSEEDWCYWLLEQHNILVQPGFFYDFESEAYLVLSLLTPPERLQAGVNVILG